MVWIIITSILLLVPNGFGKETQTYKITGVDLLHALRGFPSKEEVKFTKVEGDRFNLPDGIYFVPEDDALETMKSENN
ncbi:hypothetical protein K1T71_002075 [Dendrolimus kikuchii]|uniref:Uncharacterized protein n=1 Tax=Dendrolimus kikuchii TaxID=765133 RepID=A0ACC1DFT1_9NEOP|nr:hypothetical protein K1T71_002075 [Dendrolimus kikuchii]